MGNLDKKDLEILRILQDNSNLTTKELAAKVNLSPTPVFERIRQMEEKGYITKYGAVLNRNLLGIGLCAFCNIRLKQHNRDCILHFVNAISNIEEITECYNISGDYDFMIKIMVKDMDHYQDFIQNKLGTIDSLGSLHSLFVLKEVKMTQQIPF